MEQYHPQYPNTQRAFVEFADERFWDALDTIPEPETQGTVFWLTLPGSAAASSISIAPGFMGFAAVGWSTVMYTPTLVAEAMLRSAAAHPVISLNSSVLGGIPHIAGTRLSVGQLLGRIYVLGSIQEVANYYRGDVSVNQIKEAIAYAQDFIEAVCEPSDADAR